ncbi:Alpha/beta hydrolase fold-3 [Lasallia pustulata]|uniref:Alpha/beta hydrolase fold-3 n=1 Tax=Lasallia pustulata TaxID=136370 RepID=A0A1W5DDI4_9LECA|nr:Alpha/beta hydrolase fold-3 [Lasallia pustulata]
MRRAYNAILNAPSTLWATPTFGTPRLPRSLPCRHLSIVDSPKLHQVEVGVGSSGHVILDIHNPANADAANPIILYLPRGPCLAEPPHPPTTSALSALNHITDATTIQINYRISSTLPFPTPVHDVLACYDWVLKTLVHGPASWQNPPRFPRVGICGELVGGSLAAMLALTECHSQKPGRISAAALGNPIADWTFPAAESPHEEMDAIDLSDSRSEAVEPLLRKRTQAKQRTIDSWTAFANSHSLSAQALLSVRDTFFTKPEKWFDPFASPLLFFRTATTEIPTLEQRDPATDPATDSATDPASVPVKKRKARRPYPPLYSDLRLPIMRVDVGEESLLRDQGVELAERVKRSSPSYMKQAAGWGEGLATEQLREDVDVELVKREGVGLWGEDELVEVGRWLGEALCRHKG